MFLKQTAYKPKSRTSSQSSIPPAPDSPTTTPALPEAAATKPRTASQTWEDRRFMWQTGARKSSFSSSAVDDTVPAVQKSSSPFAMSKPNTSENPHPSVFVKGEAGEGPKGNLRDRHVIWSKGREVHEGVGERRKSSAAGDGMGKSGGVLAGLMGSLGGK